MKCQSIFLYQYLFKNTPSTWCEDVTEVGDADIQHTFKAHTLESRRLHSIDQVAERSVHLAVTSNRHNTTGLANVTKSGSRPPAT
jgi:hypothetical protein